MGKRKVLIPQLDMSDAEKEWVGMPEYLQEDKQGCRSIVVHFKDKVDVENFAKLVQQKITQKTKSI